MNTTDNSRGERNVSTEKPHAIDPDKVFFRTPQKALVAIKVSSANSDEIQKVLDFGEGRIVYHEDFDEFEIKHYYSSSSQENILEFSAFISDTAVSGDYIAKKPNDYLFAAKAEWFTEHYVTMSDIIKKIETEE